MKLLDNQISKRLNKDDRKEFKDKGLMGLIAKKGMNKINKSEKSLIYGNDEEGNVIRPLIYSDRSKAKIKFSKLKEKGYRVILSKELQPEEFNKLFLDKFDQYRNIRSYYKSNLKAVKKNSGKILSAGLLGYGIGSKGRDAALGTSISKGSLLLHEGAKGALKGLGTKGMGFGGGLVGAAIAHNPMALVGSGASMLATTGGVLISNKFRKKPHFLIKGVDKNGHTIKPVVSRMEKFIDKKVNELKKGSYRVRKMGPMDLRKADQLAYQEVLKMRKENK